MTVEVPVLGCVDTPPPVQPELEQIECAYEICLDEENARKLINWVAPLKRWADDTWTLCKEDTDD